MSVKGRDCGLLVNRDMKQCHKCDSIRAALNSISTIQPNTKYLPKYPARAEAKILTTNDDTNSLSGPLSFDPCSAIRPDSNCRKLARIQPEPIWTLSQCSHSTSSLIPKYQHWNTMLNQPNQWHSNDCSAVSIRLIKLQWKHWKSKDIIINPRI